MLIFCSEQLSATLIPSWLSATACSALPSAAGGRFFCLRHLGAPWYGGRDPFNMASVVWLHNKWHDIWSLYAVPACTDIHTYRPAVDSVHHVTQSPLHLIEHCFTWNSSFILSEQLLVPFSGEFLFLRMQKLCLYSRKYMQLHQRVCRTCGLYAEGIIHISVKFEGTTQLNWGSFIFMWYL